MFFLPKNSFYIDSFVLKILNLRGITKAFDLDNTNDTVTMSFVGSRTIAKLHDPAFGGEIRAGRIEKLAMSLKRERERESLLAHVSIKIKNKLKHD